MGLDFIWLTLITTYRYYFFFYQAYFCSVWIDIKSSVDIGKEKQQLTWF